MTEEQKEQIEITSEEDNNQHENVIINEAETNESEQLDEQIIDAPETKEQDVIDEIPDQPETDDIAESEDVAISNEDAEPENTNKAEESKEITEAVDYKDNDESTDSVKQAEPQQIEENVQPETEPQSKEEETIVEANDDNDQDFEPTIESVIEAILFASDEPITPVRLAKITEISIKELKKYVKNLNSKYKTNQNSFRIEQIAGGLQMMTLPPYSHWLRKLIRVRGDSKLSPAALETLAIIAYKQPIIRADVETVRGVAAGEMIRSLMFKGLVKIAGRAEILGRPMLYGTTKKFLEIFGLNSLKDLPKIEELKKPRD